MKKSRVVRGHNGASSRHQRVLGVVAALAWMSLGCEDGASKIADPTFDAEGPLYAVQANVNAPEGRLVYIHLIPSLDAQGRLLDPAQAIEVSGYSTVQAFDGALFISDPETRTITRWEVDAGGKATPGARLSLVNEELSTFWNENFLYVDAETAWYANEASSEILVWNPGTMELKGRIPVDIQGPAGLTTAFAGLTRVGRRVFLPVSFVDWDTNEADGGITLAVFSVEDQTLTNVFRDDRCMAGSVLPELGVADDGTYHLIGDAWSGAWIHGGTPKAPPACALRVLPGADGFDPDWKVVLDGAIEGYADMSTLVLDEANGRVFTDLMKQRDEPFATLDDFWEWRYTEGHTRRVVCDLDDWSNCRFADEGMEGTVHWFSAKLDDRVLMTSLLEWNNDDGTSQGCAVYDMTREGPIEKFRTVGFISNIVRVR